MLITVVENFWPHIPLNYYFKAIYFIIGKFPANFCTLLQLFIFTKLNFRATFQDIEGIDRLDPGVKLAVIVEYNKLKNKYKEYE